MTSPLTLYDYRDSGNGYKCRLLLAHLNRPYQLVECDIDQGATRTPEFLAMNPNGRIPLLETGPGQFLPESNAIIWYLSEGSLFRPDDSWGQAQALQWMFFEQYSHEPYVATPRYILRHLGRDHPRAAEIPARLEKGHAALQVMEQHLSRQDFFVGSRFSVADIALYAYTHRADEADIDLTPYSSIRAWLARVAAQPGHVPML